MKAMLLAAGLGTRLQPFTNEHPKALAEVAGRTLLEHNILYLQRFGCTEVIVNVHHFAEQIEAALKHNNGWGSSITISDERSEVLETGGGLKKAAHFFTDGEPFVLMNVDVLTDLDLLKMLAAHRASGAAATLAVMDRPSSRQFLFDENNKLCGWQNNVSGAQRIAVQTETMLPRAFSGIQVLDGHFPKTIIEEGKFSLVDVYLSKAAAGISIKGYDHTGDRFIDVGKPERVAAAEAMFFQAKFWQ